MRRSVSTTFAEVTLTDCGLPKNLSDGTVMADTKAVYVGSRGNWKFSWKHVTEVTFRENRSLIIKTIKDQTFECLDADPFTCQSFFEFMEKQWTSKSQDAQLIAPEKPVTSTRRPTKARRTYGRSGTRPRVSVTPVTNFSSDDEQETTKESWREQPEQDFSLDHEEEEDASMQDEEDVVKEEPPPKKGIRSKRRLLKKAHTTHEDDSDEDVFDDSTVVATTTPAAQRIVSPANATPTKESETPAEPPTKGNTIITSFFSTKTAAVKPKTTTSQRAATPTKKTRPALPLSLTPTRRPLKRDTEWLTSPRSTPRTKQARSRFFDDDDSDVESVRALSGTPPPPKNMGSGLFSTREKGSIESSPPTRRRFFMKRPRMCRGFQPQATPLRPSPKRSLADAALGLSSPSLKRPIANPYRAKPREDIVARCPFPGLKNLGNTCYLNSSLQMLYCVPAFVASLKESGGDLSNSIVKVWKDLNDTASLRARNPTCVKKAMDAVTTKFVGYEQRDAHEFLSDLVDLVHDELQADQKATGEYASTLPTDEFFRMNVQVCLTCDSCGYARYTEVFSTLLPPPILPSRIMFLTFILFLFEYGRNKEEMYRHLSLDIEDHVPKADGTPTPWSIQRAMERFFEPEKRELKCEKCDEGVSATQTLRILSW
jgi:hypothetical protein